MKPEWGHDADGNWVMLNRAEFEAWRETEDARRIEQERASKRRQAGRKFGPDQSGTYAEFVLRAKYGTPRAR
jgi:hypothetical protein